MTKHIGTSDGLMVALCLMFMAGATCISSFVCFFIHEVFAGHLFLLLSVVFILSGCDLVRRARLRNDLLRK